MIPTIDWTVPCDVVAPPGEDELPHSDGDKMESFRHVLQMQLLIDVLWLAWRDRTDFFVGGDMFVYFDEEQTKGKHFRGPDVFVVTGVPKRERKSWVLWQEGKGPEVVIELISESTARMDRGEKLRVYQDTLRVPQYFLYDPFTAQLEGFALHCGRYVPMAPAADGSLSCAVLDLRLVVREGEINGVTAPWLRWATAAGDILPTQAELAEQAQAEAERAQAEAEQDRRRAAEAERRVAELEALVARLRASGGTNG
ncbi:MAG: Uma2 family endonuclease [Dehalococcoidia bacterium]